MQECRDHNVSGSVGHTTWSLGTGLGDGEKAGGCQVGMRDYLGWGDGVGRGGAVRELGRTGQGTGHWERGWWGWGSRGRGREGGWVGRLGGWGGRAGHWGIGRDRAGLGWVVSRVG